MVRFDLCPLHGSIKFQQSLVVQLLAVCKGLNMMFSALDALNAKLPPRGNEQSVSFPAPLSLWMRPSAAADAPRQIFFHLLIDFSDVFFSVFSPSTPGLTRRGRNL